MSLVWYDPFRSSSVARLSADEDFFGPLLPREFQHLMNRPWSSVLSNIDSGSQVTLDKDNFNASVDVQQFKPDEISVKVKDNTVTVEGKHEERQDEHGYISRQFVRKYVLPKDHDASKIESKLSSDGVLTITAPRIGDPKSNERQVQITHTGKPSKTIQNKKTVKK